MKHLIKKILNEFDENDFSWAEDAINEKNLPVSYDTVQPGDKVVRGINWDYEDDQDEGAEYGWVAEEYQYNSDETVEGKPYLGYEGDDNNRFSGYWVKVEWFDRNGEYVSENSYRVGPENFDLSYYQPTENVNESEETDFGWAEDMLNNVPDISTGDVIYIVDGGSKEIKTILPLDYQPRNVRYLFIIKNVSEYGDIIRQDCNPMNVVYNKEYYKDRCSDGREEYTDFELSLKLLNKHYWRKM